MVALCVATAVVAWFLRPDTEISTFPSKSLEDSIPREFGEWRIDTSIRPIIPDPTTLAAVNRIYSETVTRTYVNNSGERVMLSLAYGQRQNDTMRLHQPEGCYAGQGFGVRQLGSAVLSVEDRPLTVTRLHATMGSRHEPVTYWMVIGGSHAVTQWQAKVAQLHFGLRGFIPDGLLFRVSSITQDDAVGFSLQDRFVRDLAAAVPQKVRDGLFGS